MFRKSINCGAMLTLVVTLLGLTPGSAAAQRSLRANDHRFRPAPVYYRHHGIAPVYRVYGGIVWPYSSVYYVPYYVPYYTYVPYYVPTYVNYPYEVPYYIPFVVINPGNSSSSTDSYSNAGQARTSAPARITVRAPANAEVWINGEKTSSTGPVREYVSPPLRPGVQYGYDIEARWEENGRQVTQTQRVTVTAGSEIAVTFPIQPGKGQEKAAGAP
jgi:uncharacterized protein (TIGR03000 family)